MNLKEQSTAPNQLISDIQSRLLHKQDKYDKKHKIACIGSERYDNKIKIKEFLFELQNKVGIDDILILSGGRKNGADVYVRKFALDFGLAYLEYNPAYTTKNLYSAMGNWFYGKEFSIKHLYSRNKLMIDNCTMLIIFLNETEKINSEFQQLINSAQKKNIKTLIIN